VNKFNQAQLNVIKKLADSYFNEIFKDPQIDPYSFSKIRDIYVEGITAGLIDPTYWGENV
jgi:hypothetical protein